MLIQTKLIRPRLPEDLVDRPRLRSILDAGLKRRVTVISAPAGFGKTTLVADWASRGTRPTAWLSLDQFDQRRRRFVQYLSAAIERVAPDALPHTEGLLQRDSTPWKVLEETFVAEIARLDVPLNLVLDDYHLITGPPDALPICQIVEGMPAGVHVVLVTRAEPLGLPLHLWRARGWLQELGAEELRFTGAEAALFRAGSPVGSASALAEGPDALEGWPAGLRLEQLSKVGRLASQSPKASPMDVARAFIRSEVLAELPEDVRIALLATTLPERFCADLCVHVLAGLGVEPATALRRVRRVHELNLFVVALDGEGDWFRHHALFRDTSRAFLEGAVPDDVRHSAVERAAQWFGVRGLVEEALRLWLDVGDMDRASRLVGEHLDEVLAADATRRHLMDWLDLFPEGAESGRIPLLLAQAAVAVMRGDLPAVRNLSSRAHRLLAQSDAADPERGFASTLDGVDAYERYWSGDPEEAIRLSRRVLEATSDRASGWTWTAGFHMLGQSLASLGRGEEAHAVLERIERSDFERGSRYLGNIATVRIAVDLLAGDVRKVARRARGVLAASERLDVSDYFLGSLRYGLGAAAYESNDLDEAARQFEAVRQLPYSVPGFVHHAALVGASLTARAKGDGLASEAFSRESLAYAIEMRDVRAKAISHSLAGWLAERGGTVQDVAPPPVDASMMGPWLVFPPVTFARALASGQAPPGPDAGLLYIEEALGFAEAVNARRVILALALVRGVLLHRGGRQDEARDVLTGALDTCRRLGLYRTILDTGVVLHHPLRVLPLSQELVGFRDRVLRDLGEGPIHLDSAGGPYAVLTRREQDVLGLLAQRLTNTEIAERLFIGSETVKSHLASIYRKLKVKGRREAVAQLAQREDSRTD